MDRYITSQSKGTFKSSVIPSLSAMSISFLMAKSQKQFSGDILQRKNLSNNKKSFGCKVNETIG